MALASSCAGARGAADEQRVPPAPTVTTASARATPTRIVLSPHLQSGPPGELTAWLVYGGFLEAAHRVALERSVAGDWLVHADLAARQLIASRVLAGDPRLQGLRSRYLREVLPRILQAGYMREHALLDFTTAGKQALRPGGELGGSGNGPVEEPSAGRTAAYRGWLAEQGLSMVPETWAALRVGTTLVRRSPRRDGPLATARLQAGLAHRAARGRLAR
jgi:hypothetical protein